MLKSIKYEVVTITATRKFTYCPTVTLTSVLKYNPYVVDDPVDVRLRHSNRIAKLSGTKTQMIIGSNYMLRGERNAREWRNRSKYRTDKRTIA